MTTPFKVTDAVIAEMFDPLAKGDFSLFLQAIDEDVRWVINDAERNEKSLAGTYVRFTFFVFTCLFDLTNHPSICLYSSPISRSIIY